MIEPVSDAFTTSCSPSRKAANAIINSAALPSEAFNNPPIPAPTRDVNCSVADPNRPANGTIVRAELKNIHIGSA